MSVSVLSELEQHYPRIAQALSEVWSQPDCETYLNSLVFDVRGGRQGFPAEVADELLLLSYLMERRPSQYDIWHEADLHT